jgi:hypothetical protein
MARTQGILDWFRPPERNPTSSVVGLCVEGTLLEWSSRPPYMAGGLGFPVEVGGPSSGSLTDLGRSPSVITEMISQSSDLLAAPPP